MTLRELLIGRSLGRSLIRGLTVAALQMAASQFLFVPVRAHGISMIEETRLGPDEVFVIGDNRSMPARLHDFGRADCGRILGPTIF
jgi:hypothetical protein